ncbi:MAG: acyltransferase family protein [Phycisphaerales bacterium]
MPAVDGLRFVAVATVVLYHVATYIGNKLYAVPEGLHLPPGPSENPFYRFGSLGFFGVQLFFAISGFILAVPFAHSTSSLKPGRSPSRPTSSAA